MGCHLMLIIVVLQVETDALPTFMPVCLSLSLLVIDICARRWLASLHIGLVFSLPVHLIQFLPHVCKFCDETTLGRNVDIHRAVDVGDLVLGPANFSVDLAVRLACSLLVGSVSLRGPTRCLFESLTAEHQTLQFLHLIGVVLQEIVVLICRMRVLVLLAVHPKHVVLVVLRLFLYVLVVNLQI